MIDADQFAGRVAIVTGAGKGLGAAIAEVLAERGATTVVVDSDADAGRQVANGLAARHESVFVEADVSVRADTERVVTEAMKAFGRIDILVNNAGIQRYGTVVETSEEEWDRVLGVNLKSMFLMSRGCIPRMLERDGGAVVNMASVQGFTAQHGVAAYAASKGGVVMLTRAMAVDFAPRVRVNAVAPGSVDTPMLREAAKLFADDPEKAVGEWGQMHPMGRVARPEEVARTVAFLAGPESSFTTGSILTVDGGLLSILPGT